MLVSEPVQNAQSAAPMLEIRALARRLGPNFSLGPMDLSIAPREIVCLVGHSGCGKSTLLRLIAGIDRPNSGTLRLDGRVLAGPGVFVEPEQRNIGFVFQDYALFPHLTIEQNVMFGLRRWPRAKAKERTEMLLSLTALSAMADRYPHMLSGGEQQRAALARALAPEPAVLLMDEPFSNLDRDLRERVRSDTLALLRRTNTTAVIVTHDPEEALSTGDRLVLMKGGRIVQIGTGRELYHRPSDPYSAEFFSTFTRVPGVYREGSVQTVLGAFPCSLDVPDGTRAVAYIRPQAVYPSPVGTAMTGRVRSRSFRGEIEQLELDVEGLGTPLIMRTTQHVDVVEGKLRFRIEEEAVFTFAMPGPGDQ
ncbi:ABC transporter ATP-binding protein [Chelativorans composti]